MTTLLRTYRVYNITITPQYHANQIRNTLISRNNVRTRNQTTNLTSSARSFNSLNQSTAFPLYRSYYHTINHSTDMSTEITSQSNNQPNNDGLNVLSLYKAFATLPELTNAWIEGPNEQTNDQSIEWPEVRLQTSVRDIEQDTKREYHTIYTPHSNSQATYRSSRPIQSETIGTFPSPSNKYCLIIRKLVSKQPAGQHTSPQYIFDVVDQTVNRLIDSIVTTGIHGRVFTGGFFGSVDWSIDESMVAYVADGEHPKSTPFFDAKRASNSSTDNQSSNSADTRGRQYEWKEDYGELLTGVMHPRPFILSINQASTQSILSILPIEGLPVDKWTLGQVFFTPSINQSTSQSLNRTLHQPNNQTAADSISHLSLVCVGWDHSDRRAGVAAYNSRPSNLYHMIINQSVNKTNDQSKDQLKSESNKQSNESTSKQPNNQSSNSSTKLELKSMYQLTDSKIDHSALGPRFSPFQSNNRSNKLVFTSTDAVWHHQSTTRLRLINWDEWCNKIANDVTRTTANTTLHTPDKSIKQSTEQPTKVNTNSSFALDNARTVIDIVHSPDTVDSFPGFYPMGGMLPANCFVDDNHILTTSQWRIRDKILTVNIDTGSIINIDMPVALDSMLEGGSMSVMSVKRRFAVVSAATLIRPAAAYIMHLSFNLPSNQSSAETFTSFSGPEESVVVTWCKLSTSPKLMNAAAQDRFESLQFDVLHIKPDDSTVDYKSYDKLPFDAILITRKQSDNQPKMPLHLLPHGGPHAAFSTAFSFACSYLACAGHALLLINYRGSTAYGQDMLECLPGHCGDMDVRDCMQSLKVVHSDPRFEQLIDKTQTGVFGGSHGGFLTTHLIGQYPDTFYVASTRNPVTNCALMVGLTDIVDWVYHEVGLEYSTKKAPTAAEYSVMFNMSPIAHIDKVKTPILMLLGAADRRVPPQQGVDYYRILKSRGVDARLLMYPDAGHSLNDSVAQEADVWCNTLMWMQKRRPGDTDLSC